MTRVGETCQVGIGVAPAPFSKRVQKRSIARGSITTMFSCNGFRASREYIKTREGEIEKG